MLGLLHTFDLCFKIDNEGRLRTKLYNKRDDVNFHLPAAPVYGVYISKLIRYSSWLSWGNHFESSTVATMTWLTVTEYLCHKWPSEPQSGHIIIYVLSPVCTHVDQELPTLLEYMNSPPVVSGVRVTRYLVFCVLIWR
jgi:hypothetical protein